jgi:hypothetical protein
MQKFIFITRLTTIPFCFNCQLTQANELALPHPKHVLPLEGVLKKLSRVFFPQTTRP